MSRDKTSRVGPAVIVFAQGCVVIHATFYLHTYVYLNEQECKHMV